MKDGDTLVHTQYAIVPVWISEHGAHAILVYFALGTFARYDEGTCWPSQASIAERAGISERSVRSALKVLCDAGAVVREERERSNGSRTTDLYRLRLDRPAESARQDVPGSLAPGAGPEREDSIPGGPGDVDETGRARATGKVGVGTVVLGAKVTQAEHDKATLVLADFNRMAGTRVTLETREHLRLIVGRIREHPELELSDIGRIIEANLADPWWDGRPSLNVIFSPKVFSIAMERGKEWAGSNGARPAKRGQQSLEDLVAMADRFDAEDAARDPQ